jgi:fructokinase
MTKLEENSCLLKKNGEVDNSMLIQISNLSTGEVIVQLNEKRSASYNHQQIFGTKTIADLKTKLGSKSGCTCFRSLVCRDEAKFLLEIITIQNIAVFDVNFTRLRNLKKYWLNSTDAVHFIKFNDDELYEVLS